MISIYSLIWTFINCGVMTLLIKFLRRKKNFLARYGTFTLLVLSICSVIRLLVPVEFPKLNSDLLNKDPAPSFRDIAFNMAKPYVEGEIPDY